MGTLDWSSTAISLCAWLPDRSPREAQLDDALLVAAQRELGTTGVSVTVRTALRLAAAAGARARQIEWLSASGLGELADTEARAAVWS